jgi:hypothetical protein
MTASGDETAHLAAKASPRHFSVRPTPLLAGPLSLWVEFSMRAPDY